MTPERRSQLRRRTLLGGFARFDDRLSGMTLRVRNLSEAGARLELDETYWLPEHFEMEMGPQAMRAKARVVWRDDNAVGVRFDAGQVPEAAPQAATVEQQLRARIAQLEKEKLALENRVKRLTEEF